MKKFKVRISESVFERLSDHLFSRYPFSEWATFLECGWQETRAGVFMTIKEMILPDEGDLQADVDLIEIDEAYSLRSALFTEPKVSALGLVHSHPQGSSALPSRLDDDMDRYYAEYLRGFTRGRPYISLILAKHKDGSLRFSGRAFYNGEWIVADRLQIVGTHLRTIASDNVRMERMPPLIAQRIERLTGVTNKLTADRLWGATVGVVGCGGTGSAAIHSLARSCVRRLVIVDPESLSISNFERVHGCEQEDLAGELLPKKIDVMRRLVAKINPDIEVVAFDSSAHRLDVIKALGDCDLILGCSDSNSGRAIVSDVALRFLIPCLNVNVCLEATADQLTDQIIQFTQFGPGLPCAYCRCQVNSQELAQELMSNDERTERQARALAAGVDAGMYWISEPVIPTTGALATAAAEIAVNYAIGLITETSSPPQSFFEINLLRPFLGVVAPPLMPRKDCVCSGREGQAQQVNPWLGY